MRYRVNRNTTPFSMVEKCDFVVGMDELKQEEITCNLDAIHVNKDLDLAYCEEHFHLINSKK